jgi:hypothetical protein
LGKYTVLRVCISNIYIRKQENIRNLELEFCKKKEKINFKRRTHSLLLYLYNRDTRVDTRITKQSRWWEGRVIAKP